MKVLFKWIGWLLFIVALIAVIAALVGEILPDLIR